MKFKYVKKSSGWKNLMLIQRKHMINSLTNTKEKYTSLLLLKRSNKMKPSHSLKHWFRATRSNEEEQSTQEEESSFFKTAIFCYHHTNEAKEIKKRVSNVEKENEKNKFLHFKLISFRIKIWFFTIYVED